MKSGARENLRIKLQVCAFKKKSVKSRKRWTTTRVVEEVYIGVSVGICYIFREGTLGPNERKEFYLAQENLKFFKDFFKS